MLIQFSLREHKNNCVKAIKWYYQISMEEILKLIYEHTQKKENRTFNGNADTTLTMTMLRVLL